MRKQNFTILYTIISLLLLCSSAYSTVSAQNASNYGDPNVIILPSSPDTESVPQSCSNPFTYKTLVDIPGFTEEDGLVTICPSSIGTFLQTIFNYIIGIAILLTVVMIIYGGVQYATVEAVTGKSQAKATIMGALQGLALALGSVLILTTINPDLVKFNLDIGRLNLRTATEGGTGSLVDLGSGLSVVQNEGGSSCGPISGSRAPAELRSIFEKYATPLVSANLLEYISRRESIFNTNAKASNSSATGLFQFLDGTWYGGTDREGKFIPGVFLTNYDKYPESKNAFNSCGGRSAKQCILDLRKNPVIATQMMIVFSKGNADFLQIQNPQSYHIYAAHFLGAPGARQMLRANSSAFAADINPKAANSNRYVFYKKNGSKKTITEFFNDIAITMGSGTSSSCSSGSSAQGSGGTNTSQTQGTTFVGAWGTNDDPNNARTTKASTKKIIEHAFSQGATSFVVVLPNNIAQFKNQRDAVIAGVSEIRAEKNFNASTRDGVYRQNDRFHLTPASSREMFALGTVIVGDSNGNMIASKGQSFDNGTYRVGGKSTSWVANNFVQNYRRQ